MSKALADLYDEHGEALRVAAPLFRDYGGRLVFEGPVCVLKVFEDNTLVRAKLEQPGAGRVLVVDGGGSMRCALVGDQLGELAVKNAWAGLVVYGCVRDSEALMQLPVGIKALGSNPRKSVRRRMSRCGLRRLPSNPVTTSMRTVTASSSRIASSTEGLSNVGFQGGLHPELCGG